MAVKQNKLILGKATNNFPDKCFVIQPFNDETLNKRFDDIFRPVILEAGLEPYRVDGDFSADILIDKIEKEIRESIICFAEITTDNPNVWYELGYAFASNKDVVMVCSEERKHLPFDIQHRQVIKYMTGSTSDFESLKEKVAKKIKALIKTKTNRFIRSKADKEWLATSIIDNPQSATYQEMIKNCQLKTMSCKFKTQSGYFRFGFKLVERNGSIFGDGIIKSTKDKNVVIHLGKNLYSRDVFVTSYLHGKREALNKPLFRFKKHEWISVRLDIVDKKKLKFYVRGELVYDAMIDQEMTQRLIMYAWGDSNQIQLLVDDIKVIAT